MQAASIILPVLAILGAGFAIWQQRSVDAVLDAHADRLSRFEQTATAVAARAEALTHCMNEMQDRVFEYETSPHEIVEPLPAVAAPAPVAAPVKRAPAKKAAPVKKAAAKKAPVRTR
mgnify:CR=1 FL=1